MKVLLVTNKYPFPSRDGVTVVSSHYAAEFKKLGAEVDLLYLNDGKERDVSIEVNREQFGTLFSCSLTKKGKVASYIQELTGRIPYFANWHLSDKTCSVEQEYDLVWVTPRAVLEVVHVMRESGALRCDCLIGGVNDIVALRYQQMSEKNIGSKSLNSRCQALLQRLRSQMLWTSEKRLLERCDRLHVQTNAELNWLHKTGALKLLKSTVVQANGVDDYLFDVPVRRGDRTLLFLGALDGMYLDRLEWFLSDVLPLIQRAHPEVKVHVVGRCKDTAYIQSLHDRGIHYTAFVDSLSNLFEESSILIAPIFKGYGLINKVVQAMAAGTLVVGDSTAYNGIQSFQNGVHGLVAETAEEFSEQIDNALNQTDNLEEIRMSARHLVRAQFNWGRGLQNILQSIDNNA